MRDLPTGIPFLIFSAAACAGLWIVGYVQQRYENSIWRDALDYVEECVEIWDYSLDKCLRQSRARRR